MTKGSILQENITTVESNYVKQKLELGEIGWQKPAGVA